MIDLFISAGIKATAKGGLVYKRQPVTIDVLRQVGIEIFGKEPKRLTDFIVKYDDKNLSKLLDAIKDKLVPKQELVDISKVLFSESPQYFYSEIKLFSDIKDAKHTGVITPSGKREFWVTPVLREKIKMDLGDSACEFYATNLIVGSRGYYPKNNDLLIVEGDMTYLNLWIKPKWELCESLISEPQEFKIFMEYLYPDEPDRRYMYAWVRDMVEKKAGAIVILSGKPGIGKNIFVEHICKPLVGEENYTAAARGEASGNRFHSNILNSRLCFFDELELNNSTRNSLKSFHNDYATIERKGENVDKPKRIHASFVIANNYPDRIVLEYSDRKFFAPRLPEVSMLDKFGREWIDAFIEKLKEDAYIRAIYNFCYEQGKGVNSIHPHKNDTFNKYCFNGFPPVIRKIARSLETQDSIDGADLRTRLAGFEIQDYLRQYEENFGKPLADFIERKKGRWTVTRPGICKGDYDIGVMI